MIDNNHVELKENKVICFVDKNVAYSSHLVEKVEPTTIMEISDYSFDSTGESPILHITTDLHLSYDATLLNKKRFNICSTVRKVKEEEVSALSHEDFIEWLEEDETNQRKDGKSSYEVFKKAVSYVNRIRKRLEAQKETTQTVIKPAPVEETVINEPIMAIVKEADTANQIQTMDVSTVNIIPTKDSTGLTIENVAEEIKNEVIPQSAPIHVEAELTDLKTVEEEEALEIVTDEEFQKMQKKIKYINSKLQNYVDACNNIERENKPVSFNRYKGDVDLSSYVTEDFNAIFSSLN